MCPLGEKIEVKWDENVGALYVQIKVEVRLGNLLLEQCDFGFL